MKETAFLILQGRDSACDRTLFSSIYISKDVAVIFRSTVLSKAEQAGTQIEILPLVTYLKVSLLKPGKLCLYEFPLNKEPTSCIPVCFFQKTRGQRTEIPQSSGSSGGPCEAALLGTVCLDSYKRSKLVPQGITHFILINIQCSKILEFQYTKFYLILWFPLRDGNFGRVRQTIQMKFHTLKALTRMVL